MYDFANSSYTTLISTVAYSVYFRQAVVGAANPRGDILWSATQVVALALLIVGSPVLGALADYSGRRKAFLLVTTVQTVVACALLWFVRPGDVALGMVLAIVGLVGFEGGYVFYNAFLPDVSTPRTIGRVSGLSWGTGFLGGLAALVACFPLLDRPLLAEAGSTALDPGAVADYRASFVVVAAFFAVFSIPTFIFLRERVPDRPALGSATAYVRTGLLRVTDTLKHLRRYRETAKFVAASMFYFGGIDTVIKFSAIYAAVTFHIDGRELMLLFVFTNIVAVPGTLAAGWLADRIGGKRALVLTLVGWIALLVFGALARSKLGFWAMAAGVAVGMGGTQAVGRSFMAQLSPRSRESEFFGFYILCNKIGAILALGLFGAVSSWTGNQRLAVLAIVPMFAVGLALTGWVDADRAQRSALE